MKTVAAMARKQVQALAQQKISFPVSWAPPKPDAIAIRSLCQCAKTSIILLLCSSTRSIASTTKISPSPRSNILSRLCATPCPVPRQQKLWKYWQSIYTRCSTYARTHLFPKHWEIPCVRPYDGHYTYLFLSTTALVRVLSYVAWCMIFPMRFIGCSVPCVIRKFGM